MIIAIETATAVCSVAAGKNGKTLIEKRVEGRGVHSSHTFLFIKEILERYRCKVEDLEAILFSKGPGSYTGLRIGASAIKGLLFGKSVPLYTCSTLSAISVPHLLNSRKTVHAVLDARRNHLYHQQAVLLADGMFHTEGAGIKKISDIRSLIQKDDIGAGTGTERLGLGISDVANVVGKEHISASNLIHAWYDERFKTIFQEEEPANFEPEYLSVSQINNSSIK